MNRKIIITEMEGKEVEVEMYEIHSNGDLLPIPIDKSVVKDLHKLTITCRKSVISKINRRDKDGKPSVE